MGLWAELGDVLSGVGADRQEGRGLPEARRFCR